jgi:hypothetical protein
LILVSVLLFWLWENSVQTKKGNDNLAKGVLENKLLKNTRDLKESEAFSLELQRSRDELNKKLKNYLREVSSSLLSSQEKSFGSGDNFYKLEAAEPESAEQKEEKEGFFVHQNEASSSFKKVKIPSRVLSDEEWFKIAYPDYYVDALKRWQDLMAKDGYFDKEGKYEFRNEDELFAFLFDFIDYFAKKGFISQEQKERFIYGVDVELRHLNNYERFLLRKPIGLNLENLFASIGVSLINKAEAVAGDCFRAGPPNPLPGPNLWAICCNCGIGCGPDGCWEVARCSNASGAGVCLTPDCLGKAEPCEEQLGCLGEEVCPPPLNAIWDPMTGICGCDPF